MIKSHYETTVLRSHILKNTVAELEKEFVADRLLSVPDTIGIYTISPDNRDIKPLIHPVTLESGATVIDLRGCIKLSNGGDIVIRGLSEYNFIVAIAKVSRLWMRGAVDEMRTLNDTPVVAYAYWLTTLINQALRLNPEQYGHAVIVCAFHYFSMFTDHTSEDDLSMWAARIARSFRVNTKEVTMIATRLGQGEYTNDIKGLLQKLMDVIPSPRIEELSVTSIYAMVGNSWFGLGGREIIQVAIEYPPYFICLLLAAFENSLYQKTSFAKAVLGFCKPDQLKVLSRNLDNLLNM